MLTLSRTEEHAGQGHYNPIRRFLHKEGVAGYLFIAPWIIGFILFSAYPLLDTIYNSFTEYKLFGEPQWIGLQNYEKLLFHDQVFGETRLHMLLYVVLATLIYIIGSMILALLLNRAFPGNHFFRTVFYPPSLMVGVAIGAMFVQIFNSEDYGLMNEVIGVFHIHPINWLNNYDHPIVGLFALIFVNFWFMGGTMLIFLAGLKGISPTYYEAARIDGCSNLCIWWNVILPQSKPVVIVAAIFTFLTSWRDAWNPLIYLSSQSNRTIPLGLLYFTNGFTAVYPQMKAATMPFTRPVTEQGRVEPEQQAYTDQLYLGPFFPLQIPSSNLRLEPSEEAAFLNGDTLHLPARQPGSFWSFYPRLTQVSDRPDELGSAGPFDTLLTRDRARMPRPFMAGRYSPLPAGSEKRFISIILTISF
jgi:ABC-type sugar transport system permease subunit